MISKSFFKFKGKIVRSHYNTDLSTKNIGEVVRLCGWANSYRDHGGIIFIDLRDRSGLIQLVCDPKDSQKAHQIAESVRNEFVLIARGKVRARGEGLTNAKLKTGEIEVVVDELVIERAKAPRRLLKSAMKMSMKNCALNIAFWTCVTQNFTRISPCAPKPA